MISTKITNKPMPNIQKRVFWDVDYDTLDFEKDKFYIIEKVINHGVGSDFIGLVNYYGKATIKQEIVKSTHFKKETLNFICFYFHLSLKDFPCYNLRQSIPQQWSY